MKTWENISLIDFFMPSPEFMEFLNSMDMEKVRKNREEIENKIKEKERKRQLNECTMIDRKTYNKEFKWQLIENGVLEITRIDDNSYVGSCVNNRKDLIRFFNLQ